MCLMYPLWYDLGWTWNTPRGAFQDLHKGAQKGSPEIALEDALLVALFLCNSQCIIWLVTFNAALEGTSKVSLLGALKTAYKVDGPFVNAIESAPEATLKLQLMMNLAIYIKAHKKVHLRLHSQSCTWSCT